MYYSYPYIFDSQKNPCDNSHKTQDALLQMFYYYNMVDDMDNIDCITAVFFDTRVYL